MASSVNGNPRAPGMLAWTWSFFGLATVAVILRFTARKIRRLKWEIDDYAVLVALFYTLLTCICNTFFAIYGIGQHVNELTPTEISNFLKALYCGNFAYVGTGPSFKIAALLMYRRVFTTPKFQQVTMVLCWLCFAWYMAETLGSVFVCIPPRAFWDPTVKGKCVSTRNFDLQYAVINICLDAIIIALPIKMIAKLQLSLYKKVALSGVFLVGIIVTIVAIVRIILFVAPLDVSDWTYVYYRGVLLTTLEPEIGVIGVCLPVMRPVLVAMFPQKLRSSVTDAVKSIIPSSHRSRSPKPTSTISNFRRRQKGGDSDLDSRPFARLESTDMPLQELEPSHMGNGYTKARAIGSEARSDTIDDEVTDLNGILKRTDVELQYEASKDTKG